MNKKAPSILHDALVIGGSYAGLAAATYIARARRQVRIVDSGLPRNRFSPAAHGFLGQDGRAPADILASAREQVLAYPTARLHAGEVIALQPRDNHFEAQLADGDTLAARKVVIAAGVRDALPALPGLSERWGNSVLHCPYCHGYEARGPLGVLGTHPMSAHQAMLVRDWGPVTLFTQGAALEADTLAQLSARDVAVETAPIAALLGQAPALDGVRLEDGRQRPLGALFVAPRVHLPSLVAQLALETEEGPMGRFLRTDERRMTSLPGVYAAGDLCRAMHSVSFAVADGVNAGVSLHQALVAEALA